MEQTKQLQDSFMPEKFRVLSGSALKVLAMVIMLIDHTAAFLLVKSAAATRTLFVLGDTDISSLQDHAGCGQGCISHLLFSSGGGLCPYTQPL